MKEFSKPSLMILDISNYFEFLETFEDFVDSWTDLEPLPWIEFQIYNRYKLIKF